MPILGPSPYVNDPARFAARMTSAQFSALAVRLNIETLAIETAEHIRSRRANTAASYDPAQVSRWLVNGWSTERLLYLNQAAFPESDSLRHSLHWAFPQAYYSVFSLTIGYFKTVGYTEMSHKAVLRKFALEAHDGRYPAAMAFTASGASPEYHFIGLRATSLPTTVTFDASDPSTVDGQIAQYLRATRNQDLKAKKQDLNFKTSKGQKRKSLRKADWEVVSGKLGPTALLHLLYRKRIKANYHDIETFLHPELEPHRMYRALLAIVGAINFVHEAFIARAAGLAFVHDALLRLPECSRERVESRLARIRTQEA
jgi:hypothetical protein